MFNQHTDKNQSILTNIVPAYGYYDRMGNSLAESLVNFFEIISDLLARFRR
jgi:hypothetical protein